ncbi:MAG: Na+/H+ antiporter NhaA [Desulfopila sp.]|jgi:NhaA family Na+:H+ antiporter|nr:Na+/H+ antiporter NhaA [Desulfopila sp.]
MAPIKHLENTLEGLISPVAVVAKALRNSAFQHFFTKISQSGFLLLAAAVAAFVWSNLDSEGYLHFWHQELVIGVPGFAIHHSLVHWVNEALMAVFFLTVGLEIKREMLVGALSDRKRAALPLAAALGGMAFPGLIYFIFNFGADTSSGWGIPMATDIAFSLAILSTLGKRVPFGIRLFLTAFAIADDLGAILIIAFFYTPTIELSYLAAALGFVGCLYLLNRFWVLHILPYFMVGLLLWFALSHSGLHATIAGVVVAMFIPAVGRYDTNIFLKMVREKVDNMEKADGAGSSSIIVNQKHLRAVQEIELGCREVATPLQRLEHSLSSWVGFLVLPLFALANAGVVLKSIDLSAVFFHPVTLGVAVGLALGKPMGIFSFTYLASKLFKTDLQQGVSWRQIFGVSCLGGIGFTMSLFISGLSFATPAYLEYAKIGIITGSLVCGVMGYCILRRS